MASNKSQQPKKGAPSGKAGPEKKAQQPPQKTPRRRRGGRGRRGRGGRQRKGQGDYPFNRMSIPSNYAYFRNQAMASQPTKLYDKRWGEGISLPFSQLITTCSVNASGGPFDSFIVMIQNQITNANIVTSGVQDTGGLTCTGLLVHPGMLGGRFITETNNWTRYRFRKLCASFIPFVGTGTNGAVVMHINTDPNKWPEIVDNKSELEPSLTNLSSARPMVEGPIWTEQDVCVTFNGQETWPCDLITNNYDTSTGFYGSLAYIRETYQYRFAMLAENINNLTASENFGRLYLSGVIEMFQPSYGTISGAGTVTAPTAALLSSTSVPSTTSQPKLQGSWRTGRPTVGSKEPVETKQSDPDDPILIPPMPVLKRSTAQTFHDRFNKP